MSTSINKISWRQLSSSSILFARKPMANGNGAAVLIRDIEGAKTCTIVYLL